MALTEIKTSGIADDAVTTDKLANAINTERTANTAKVSLDADSVTGAKIADDAVGAEHIEQLDADLSFADSAKAKFGAGNDLQLYHDGTDSYVANTTGTLYILPKSGENGIQLVPDGAVRLYYDNSKKLETSDYGTWLGDNSRITLGGSAGTPDCHFYHDGTDTNLQNITGDLVIKSTSGGAKAIVAKNGGAVELYHNNVKQCETAADGLAFPSGKGINFNATADASGTGVTAGSETLDDYEEGTFTPTVTGNSGSLTLSNASGTYTKIGNVVYFSYYIQASSGSTGTFPKLGGLPFAMVDDSNKQSFITAKDKVGVSYSSSDYSNMYFRMDTNATTATGIAEKIDGSTHTGSVLDISGSGARLRGSGFYFV